MKRVMILVYCLLLTVFLAACGTNGSDRQSAASSALSSSEEMRTESGALSGGSQNTPATTMPVESESLPRQAQSTAPSLGDDPEAQEPESEISFEESETMQMNVQVGDAMFSATLEKNTAAEAFVEMMKNAPLTIGMSDYSGFEKVGALGASLPTDNSQTTTRPGDIVLYNGNQIVIFYGSNSWSYTRLGRIDDLSGWAEALGTGDVTVTFFAN